MRSLLALFLIVPMAVAQNASSSPAVAGKWVGVLQYRDYSEPATSTKRVELPTWLVVTEGSPQVWHYTYDDGPAKTVVEDDAVVFDPVAGRYSVAENGKPAHAYAMTGWDGLKNGLGKLEMVGAGTDNGKPAEMHVVMTVGRNILRVVEETRPAGSAEAYAFRHEYRFVRAEPPVASGAVR
jgi:hypothetical protein